MIDKRISAHHNEECGQRDYNNNNNNKHIRVCENTNITLRIIIDYDAGIKYILLCANQTSIFFVARRAVRRHSRYMGRWFMLYSTS